MKWQKWTKDNLPPSDELILIIHKHGHRGSVRYFLSEEDRKCHKKFMEDCEKSEDFDKDWGLHDPIVWWMLFPEPPVENG